LLGLKETIIFVLQQSRSGHTSCLSLVITS